MAPAVFGALEKLILAAGAAAVRASFLDIKGSPRRSVRTDGAAAALRVVQEGSRGAAGAMGHCLGT